MTKVVRSDIKENENKGKICNTSKCFFGWNTYIALTFKKIF